MLFFKIIEDGNMFRIAVSYGFDCWGTITFRATKENAMQYIERYAKEEGLPYTLL